MLFHCGRELLETRHKPSSFQVDDHRLHTDHIELDFLVNPKPDALPLRYLRLIHPVHILTCVDCYARAEIRQRLDDDINGRRALVDARAHGENLAQISPKG